LNAKLKAKMTKERENVKKVTDVCQGFGLVNSTIQKICKNRTKIISTFEQNGSRIKLFRQPERSDIDEVLLKWFKEEKSDSVPVSILLLTIFILYKL
jgi:hypothetical protein